MFVGGKPLPQSIIFHEWGPYKGGLKMIEKSETKEQCARCQMYKEALTSAIRIALILTEKEEGKVTGEAAELFRSIHFLLLELNHEHFGQA
jgi:hypothetical protein